MQEFEAKKHIDAFKKAPKWVSIRQSFNSKTMLSIHPMPSWLLKSCSNILWHLQGLRSKTLERQVGVEVFHFCASLLAVLNWSFDVFQKWRPSLDQKTLWRQETTRSEMIQWMQSWKKLLVPVLHSNISQFFQFASRRHRPAKNPWMPVHRPVHRCRFCSCTFVLWQFEFLLLKVDSFLQRKNDSNCFCTRGLRGAINALDVRFFFILRHYSKSIPRSIPPSQIFRPGQGFFKDMVWFVLLSFPLPVDQPGCDCSCECAAKSPWSFCALCEKLSCCNVFLHLSTLILTTTAITILNRTCEASHQASPKPEASEKRIQREWSKTQLVPWDYSIL